MISRKILLYKTRVAVSLRDFGIKHTIQKMFQDVLLSRFFLFRQYIIYEKHFAQIEFPKLNNPHFEFSFLSSNDNGLAEQIEKLSGISRDLVLEKVRNGGECIIARNSDGLAGFNLISTGDRVHILYLDAFLSLSKSEVWGEQITVLPQYRRSGVATDIRYKLFERLLKRGYTKLIGGYVPFNKKSGLLAKKLGFVEREKVTLVRILIWKKLYSQKLSPSPSGLLLSLR